MSKKKAGSKAKTKKSSAQKTIDRAMAKAKRISEVRDLLSELRGHVWIETVDDETPDIYGDVLGTFVGWIVGWVDADSQAHVRCTYDLKDGPEIIFQRERILGVGPLPDPEQT